MPRFYSKHPELIPDQPVLDPAHEIPEHAEHGRTAPQQNLDDSPEDNPVRVLLSWVAPSRPFRKRDRSYYTTIAIIVVLLILISLLMREFILVGVLLAVSFVAYVLGFVPPEDVEYRISTQGITIGDHFYFWTHLDSFWFSQKDDQTILHILTHYRFPGQLLLVLGEQDSEAVKRVMGKYLFYHDVAPKTMVDNWANSLQKHFPLESVK